MANLQVKNIPDSSWNRCWQPRRFFAPELLDVAWPTASSKQTGARAAHLNRQLARSLTLSILSRTMESREPRADRQIVRLLTALVVLLAVLVVSLGAGAAIAYRQYSQVKDALKQQTAGEFASIKRTVKRAEETVADLSKRQAALSASLDRQADETQRRVEILRARRSELEEIPGGVLQKGDFGLKVGLLIADQIFVTLDHMSQTQESVARAGRLLPSQADALRRPKDKPATGKD